MRDRRRFRVAAGSGVDDGGSTGTLDAVVVVVVVGRRALRSCWCCGRWGLGHRRLGRGLAGTLELLLAQQLLFPCEAGLRLSGEERLALFFLHAER